MDALESLSAKPDVQTLARERELALLTYKLELAEAIAEGESRGQAEGRAQSLITILVARGLDPSEDLRRRIAACTDLATLERWIARAIAAKSADEAISLRNRAKQGPSSPPSAQDPRLWASAYASRQAARRF